MTDSQPASRSDRSTAVSAAVDSLVVAMVARAWPEVVSIVRDHREILLANAALDELRQRMHREQRILSWHRKRRIKRLQEAEDLLVNMQQSGVEQGLQNYFVNYLHKQPLGPAFFALAAQVPELQNLVDTPLHSVLEGYDVVVAARRQQQEQQDRTVDEFIENAGELGPEFRRMAKYAVTQAKASVRNTSPVGILRAQKVLKLLAGLIPIVDELLELTRLEDQRGTFLSDLSARRKLLARRAQALLADADDKVLAATVQVSIVSILFTAAQTASQDSGQPAPDELKQYILSLQAASHTFARHHLRGMQGIAFRLLGQIWGTLSSLTGTSRKQQIAVLRQATKKVPRRAYPEMWAFLQQDLGDAYAAGRVTSGDIERSIHAFQQALHVFAQAEAYTGSEALTYFNLAGSYYLRRKGNRQRNLTQVVEHCDHALDFFQEEYVILYDNCHLLRAKALEELGRMEEAHTSLVAARRLQDALVERSNSSVGLLDVLRKKHGTDDLYLRDIQVLLKLQPAGYEQDIAVALEEGRARAMRMTLSLNLLTLQRFDPTLAAELVSAQRRWQQADRLYREPVPETEAAERKTIQARQERWVALSEAATSFKAVRDRVRAHYPKAIALIPTFEAIGQAVDAPDEAIVYLVANETTGLAVIITRGPNGRAQVKLIALPALTSSRVGALLFGTDKAPHKDNSPRPSIRPIGGFYYALTGNALVALQRWGRSMAEVLTLLPSESSFKSAIFNVTRRLASFPLLLKSSEQPFADLKQSDPQIYGSLGAIFDEELLKVELDHLLLLPSQLGFNQVARWLDAQNIHRVVVVPYGPLSLLPWPALQIDDGQRTYYFGERFDVSIAPSAYGYRAAKDHARAARADSGAEYVRPAILLAGDPQVPPESGRQQLPYAEAEIQAVAQIAQAYAQACSSDDVRARHGLSHILPPLVGEQATRENILQYAKHAWYIELAAHGRFRQEAPLHSGIKLAHGEEITLEECLDGRLELNGTRLVILSSCELSLTDVRWIENEALGMANGFLQSGVAGIIAPMWAVDDRATFLLMTRFAEVYLDPRTTRSPAQALAEAQRWLREDATNARLTRYEPYQELIDSLRASPPISRSRSPRVGPAEALDSLHQIAAGTEGMELHPDDVPYAHPMYWAGFIFTGC